MTFEEGLQVPAEVPLDGQEHVDHEVEQEPALQDLVKCQRCVTRDLTKKLTVELVLKRRVPQAGIDEVLNRAEMVLKLHWLHGSGEIELKVLEEVLGFCVECIGGKGGEWLVKTAGGPVEDRVLPVQIIARTH